MPVHEFKCDKCCEHSLDCKYKGWVYKGNHNLLREMLKEMPKGKIEIIPDDPKDQQVANQMSDVLNSSIHEFCPDCKNELVAENANCF